MQLQKPTIAILILLLGVASRGHAQIASALTFTGGTQLVPNSLTLGWAFTLSSSRVVTDLGIFDEGSDGLHWVHSVGIWTSGGTLLTRGDVGNGPLLDGFRYVAIAPIVLPAGDYTIGAEYTSVIGEDSVRADASSITTPDGITYAGSRSTPSPLLTFPASVGERPNAYFGPNFQSMVVPEPSTSVALTWGSAIVALRYRRRLT